MSVVRKDLNACIGCKKCVEICPMDVFYFDEEASKSVMLYPENCQSCGQCWLNCPAKSLAMDISLYGFGMTPGRALRTFTEYMPEEETSTGRG